MCNCQKPHRWPLMVRIGSGTAVRPDSKLPQLTPTLSLIEDLRFFNDWLKTFSKGSNPPLHVEESEIAQKGEKRGKKGKLYILKNEFSKTLTRLSFSKAFLDEAPACQDMLRQSFCTGITTVLALRHDPIHSGQAGTPGRTITDHRAPSSWECSGVALR